MFFQTTCELRNASPYIFEATAVEWFANEALGEEVFGPPRIIVVNRDMDEVKAIAKSLQGQLTFRIHMAEADT